MIIPGSIGLAKDKTTSRKAFPGDFTTGRPGLGAQFLGKVYPDGSPRLAAKTTEPTALRRYYLQRARWSGRGVTGGLTPRADPVPRG